MKYTLLFLALSLAALQAEAQRPEWAGPPGAQQERGKEVDSRRPDSREPVRERRTEQERDYESNGLLAPLNESERNRLIRIVLEEYFGLPSQDVDPVRGGMKALPPGLQKKLARGGSLPPGWQMKLARGEVLDSSLYAYSDRLPPDVLRRLGGRQEGAELIVLGDRILRVMEGRGTILDVVQIVTSSLELSR